MTGTLIITLGIAAGAGAWLAVAALWPYRPALETELARLDARIPPAEREAVTVPGVFARADRAGLVGPRTRSDLDCLGQTVPDHLARLTKTTVLAVAAALAFTLLLAAAGLADAKLAIGLTLLAAATCPVWATARLRAAAGAERDEYRRALSVFLDTAAIALAGSAGIDTALDEASTAGRGPQFARLQAALRRGRLLGQTPWQALAELGERIDVAAYRQLAATVGLAAVEGAAIRASLTDRAETLRARRLAATEARAGQATEKMSLPIVALATAFLTLIIYAAMASVFASV